MHIGGALAERAKHLPPHAGELLRKAKEDGARSGVHDVRVMRLIQLPSVALVAGVHAASPMVHTPPVAIEHPRLPVARGAEVHRLAIMQGAMLEGGAILADEN